MNGIINVYKEKGYTSHDVVAKLRSICHQKKIGHTGTLDPDAEGVLPVCFGTSTKVCDMLTDKDKEYETVLLLGKETDTQDISGAVQKEAEVLCTEADLRDIIQSFVGVYNQIPPMYSALKVNGQKLCDLARAGVEVERKARPVRIFDIAVEWVKLPRVKMRVHCSKGTYIRTLCHDIGQKAGCGGCMEELLRTRAGSFRIQDAVKLARIQEMAGQERLQDLLLPVDALFLDYPGVQVEAEYRKLLENGNRLPKQAFRTVSGGRQVFCPENGKVLEGCHFLRVYLEQDFFGIYRMDSGRGDYRPEKIFYTRGQKSCPDSLYRQRNEADYGIRKGF